MIGSKKIADEKGLANPEPAVALPESEEAKWNFGYIALLSYIFVQFTRLPMMYPFLAPLQLGKVTLIAAMIGFLLSKPANSAPGNAVLKGSVGFLAIVTTLSAISANYRVLPAADLWNIPEQLIVFFLISRLLVSRWRQKVLTFLMLLFYFKLAQHGIRNYIFLRGVADEVDIIRFGIIGGGGGFYDNAADLGVAMCVALGLSFALMQSDIGRKTRWFYALCLTAFGALIMVCGSRGAVVGAAAVMLIVWFRSPKKKWAVPVLLLFIAGLIYLIPNASKDRFESAKDWQNDQTAHHRLLLWGAGVRMWEDYPILGVGPANYQYVRIAEGYHIADPALDRGSHVCHSSYIQVLSELGTFGAIGFLVILTSFFVINAKVRERVLASGGTRQNLEYCMAAGLDLAMVGYLVSGAFVSVFWYPHIWILGGLAAGLNSYTSSLGKTLSIEVQNPENRPTRSVPLGGNLTGSFEAKRP